MVGEAVDGVGRTLTGFFLDDVALNDEGVANARELEVVVEAGGGPDRALFVAAMGQGGRLTKVGMTVTIEDQAAIRQQGRLVVFDDDDVVSTMVKEVGGERALGQQGVGGDGLAGDVQRLENRDDHPDLMGLLDFVVAVYGQGADFFWVWQVWLWWPTTPRRWV